MKTEEKGQVTIEFTLVVGAILLMTVVVIPMTLKNAEMNRALTAARDGASKGAVMRGLGFEASSGNETGVVRIINMTPEYVGKTGDLDWYRLRFYVSAPGNMDQSSLRGTIRQQARSQINYAITGQWDPSFDEVNGSYYSFTTAVSFV